MNAQEVGYLALRIVAVFVLIIALKHLPIFVSNLVIYLDPRYFGELSRDPKVITVLIIASLFPLLIFLISYLLWFKADKLCNWFLRNKAKEKADSIKISTFNLEEFQIVTFSIIGLIILVHTLPQLLNFIAQLILHVKSIGTNLNYLYEVQQSISAITIILQIAIGIYLFFGSSGLVGFWRRLREYV